MASIHTTRRSFLGGSAILAGAALAACGSQGAETEQAATTEAETTDATTSEASSANAISGTYSIHVQGYDWGCSVDKATVTLDQALDTISVDDLVVTETKQVTDWTDTENYPVIEDTFDREVTAATLGDDGKTIELEFYCSPDQGSPLLYTMSTGYNTWSEPYYLTIKASDIAAFALNIDTAYTEKTTSADAWTVDSFDATDGTSYKYASWDPAEESKTLVVWLHGAGEGGTEGTDPYVTILANKVVALSEDAFQEVVGGAHVVAPQSPTMWMDQGPDADGKPTYISEDAKEITSIYTDSLEEFIDSYADKVGAEKIVLAGCSNGGFMTLWMGIDRPDKYAAIVPICEAIPDGAISDEQIEGVKDLPMYFVWSEDDTTVVPDTHEIPTTKRLQDVGAANLHISTTEHVVDTSGEYKDPDDESKPYEYNGHWSWIYFDNNECACNEDGMKAWDFIAEAVK